MRDKETGLVKGIVRNVMSDGRLFESSNLNNTMNGLCRNIGPDEDPAGAMTVSISLWKENELLAEFDFDENFRETSRYDPNSLLADLTPEDFRLD